MARRTCGECGKPLGSTFGYCHDCGGESIRGGTPCTGRGWKYQLGVPHSSIVAAEKNYGTVLPLDPNDTNSHYEANHE